MKDEDCEKANRVALFDHVVYLHYHTMKDGIVTSLSQRGVDVKHDDGSVQFVK